MNQNGLYFITKTRVFLRTSGADKAELASVTIEINTINPTPHSLSRFTGKIELA